MTIPTNGVQLVNGTDTESIQTSKTYGLHVETGRIAGTVDGLEAMRQAVFKMMQTVRYEHFVYSSDYGFEPVSLAGVDIGFVKSELKRRIQEALLQDERITGVNEFELTADGDAILAKFAVQTIFGDFQSSLEVNTNV
ncbi:DUF2634 domain-containing protein [Paenibacillus sp. NEAU-GSW1]|uniref:DUF2634 domain-containing protein n=1 Tax=Paenibacillus sp. NEAU-GSW1 TaxID=2682486 RepID=UPI0012E11F7E|nr:DUF2634 domain-containing protein [Paenibacillus sp. NEAU-GSW1]MUT67823.1 DUF2634 domain-containing protein [Paenibacillus sp. NEAU-GSW1]